MVGFAQQHEREPHAMPSVKLGKVSFPTSCSSQAHSEVETGVESLHSFEYENAMRHFEKALQRDPNCSIAYWGKAMSLYHELWNVPSEKDLAEGWQFVQKAQADAKTSHREQDYVEAMEIFYKPGKQSALEVARLIVNPQVLRCFLRPCLTEAPSLCRSYPASSVLRTSPPPHTARPVSRELPVDPYRDHRWGFPCCVWSPMHTCHRHYPGRFHRACSLVPLHGQRPSL
jgi:hypothetical protein